MADHADEGVAVARHAGEGAAEGFIGGAAAVGVSGHEGADALLVGILESGLEARLVKGFAEIHVPAAIPGAVSGASEIGHRKRECRVTIAKGLSAKGTKKN
jgi:hypothetical protein